MTKYKADKRMKSTQDLIVENYLEGVHYSKDKYNSPVRKPMKEGTNKYNVEFLIKTKELNQGYAILISIESCIIGIVQRYSEYSNGLVGNLWHIINAQSETRFFLGRLETALKSYKICFQNVYDALKNNLNSTEERLNRNRVFLDEFIKQAGLEQFTHMIQNTYLMSVFDYTKEFVDDYFDQNKGQKISSAEYFQNLRDAYAKHIDTIAKEHNVDLENLVKTALEEKHKENEKKKLKAKEIKQDIKRKTRISKAKEIFLNNDIQLQAVIETANAQEYISRNAYSNLIEKIEQYNGVCYVVERVKHTKLEYIDNYGNPTSTLLYAAYYPTYQEAKNLLDAKKEKEPDYTYDIQKLCFPNTARKTETPAEKEDCLQNQLNQRIINYITADLNGQGVIMEKLLQYNNHKFYYIMGSSDNDRPAFFDPSKQYKLRTTNRVIPYASKEDAEKQIEKYITDYPNLVIVEFKYDKTPSIEKQRKRAENIMEKDFERLNHYLQSIDIAHMKPSLRNFVLKMQKYKKASCVIMSSSAGNTVSYMGYSDKYIMTPRDMIENSDIAIDKEGLDVLTKKLQTLRDKTTNCIRIYDMINIEYVNGQIKWELCR